MYCIVYVSIVTCLQPLRDHKHSPPLRQSRLHTIACGQEKIRTFSEQIRTIRTFLGFCNALQGN